MKATRKVAKPKRKSISRSIKKKVSKPKVKSKPKRKPIFKSKSVKKKKPMVKAKPVKRKVAKPVKKKKIKSSNYKSSDIKSLIWTNDIGSFYDYIDDWKEGYKETLEMNTKLSKKEIEEKINDENSLFDFWCELNESYLDDEIGNLKYVKINGEIIVLGKIGLWYGERSGYKEIGYYENVGQLIKDNAHGDTITIYVDYNNDLVIKESHHDGTNYLTYRKWKDKFVDNETARDKFLSLTHDKKATQLEKYTDSIGGDILKFYGVK